MMMALDALLPVLLVIATGHVVARIGLVTGDNWRGFEKLTYFVLFPCIIIRNLALVDFGALPFVQLGLTLAGAVSIVATFLLLIRTRLERRYGISPARFTSIFQGSVRWNTFVALAMADQMWGPEGVALIAVAIVAMVPLLNMLSVTVMSRFANADTPFSLTRLLRDLTRNPYIVATLVGLVINMTGLMPPEAVMTSMEMLGRCALAAGLLVVGASLDIGALRRPGPALSTAAILRLVALPTVAAGLGTLLGLSGMALAAAVLCTSVPTSSGAYLLAREMGGDAELMAEILTLQSIAAIVTLPIALVVLGAM
ncbi:AEC family transporter [Breoghania sp.]|uniref:AEC family transporter n=1 Tax=Breoghania sp. TaxID=2065378 RepID=UPI002AAA99B5|nr:AEC family transporter [Breoghania sp.]